MDSCIYQLLYSSRGALEQHGIRNGSANISRKEPGSKYFRLPGYMLSFATTVVVQKQL